MCWFLGPDFHTAAFCIHTALKPNMVSVLAVSTIPLFSYTNWDSCRHTLDSDYRNS